MARTMDKVFKRTKNISLFCSVYLAFSSFSLPLLCSLFFFLPHSVCMWTSMSVFLSTRRSSVQCVFSDSVATSKTTNFHSLSWLSYPVRYVSVTFYLKIYDCCSLSFVCCVFFSLPSVLFVVVIITRWTSASTDRVDFPFTNTNVYTKWIICKNE